MRSKHFNVRNRIIHQTKDEEGLKSDIDVFHDIDSKLMALDCAQGKNSVEEILF